MLNVHTRDKNLVWNILCHLMVFYTLRMGHWLQWLFPAALSRTKTSTAGEQIKTRPTSHTNIQNQPKHCLKCTSCISAQPYVLKFGAHSCQKHLEEQDSTHSVLHGNHLSEQCFMRSPTDQVTSRSPW